MTRQKLPDSQLGIEQTTLPSGRFQARARLCDEVARRRSSSQRHHRAGES